MLLLINLFVRSIKNLVAKIWQIPHEFHWPCRSTNFFVSESRVTRNDSESSHKVSEYSSLAQVSLVSSLRFSKVCYRQFKKWWLWTKINSPRTSMEKLSYLVGQWLWQSWRNACFRHKKSTVRIKTIFIRIPILMK